MTQPEERPYLGQNGPSPYPARELVKRVLWACVQATLFRWSPRALHGWRVTMLRLFGADIPSDGGVRVFPSVRIIFPWKLKLAARVMIGPEVIIYNLAPVSLGYGANLSQRVHLCAGSHDFHQWSMPLDARPIRIGDNVWIAAEAFVGPGVEIGELAVIGARSVVTKDQPARMVCAGVPCRPLKPRPDPT